MARFQRLRDWPSCDQHLKVGLHDPRDAVDPGEVLQFGEVELAGAPCFLEGFERYVEADLVAKLEAVGDGFGHAVDANGGAVIGDGDDALAIGGAA